MDNSPLAYFITFRTYATWLPGDERGTVDVDHNTYGSPFRAASELQESIAQTRLRHDSVELDSVQRSTVDDALRAVCEHNGWLLRSANVRSNHVHTVVGAPIAPERLMNTLKSWSTRKLVEAEMLAPGVKVWARHGSTRYLWTEAAVEAACRYVVHGQD